MKIKDLRPGALLSLFSLSLALLGLGCRSAGGVPPTFPATVKDWNGGTIDQAEFVKRFQLRSYSELKVLPIDSSQTKLPPQDENTYEPVKTVLARVDNILTTALASKLKGRIAVQPSQELPQLGQARQMLVLRIKADKVDPGSQALRMWVGFGAGSSGVGLSGELIDGESRAVLLRFQHLRASSMGAFGGDYVRMLSSDVESVAEDLGELLIAFDPTRPES